MLKSKLFLIFSIIVAMGSVFWVSMVSGAQVTKVHNRKGHIYIDRGKDAGFAKNSEVCFYAFSGEKITCGKVIKTTPSMAIVKVKKQMAKKIKKGIKTEPYVEKQDKQSTVQEKPTHLPAR